MSPTFPPSVFEAEALLRRCIDRVCALLPRAIEQIDTHQILVIYPEHKLDEHARAASVEAFAATPPGEPFVLLMPLENLYYDGEAREPLGEGEIVISVMISETVCHALHGPAATLGKALGAKEPCSSRFVCGELGSDGVHCAGRQRGERCCGCGKIEGEA